MARRSWRNFDYILLVALLILSAYGVIMIYSATINTLGVENPVQRQIIYIVAGTAVLLISASIDYRLLDIVQHPIPILTPLILGLMNVGLVITWQINQVNIPDFVPTADFFLPHLPAMVSALLLIFVVYLIDRSWLQELDLTLPRVVIGTAVILLMAAGFFALRRLPTDLQSALTPYALGASLAAVYGLDCVTLRFTDALRNPTYVLILVILGIIFLI
jgi:cell division protein FtsW (lipid II flippase)